jgi:prefoldin subunit 5
MPSSLPAETRAVENVLKVLWERVRRAAELIQQLREERQALHSQVDQLRNDVRQLQQELARKDQLLKTVQTERQHPAQEEGLVFGNGERAALARKVKDLLAKIDAYL